MHGLWNTREFQDFDFISVPCPFYFRRGVLRFEVVRPDSSSNKYRADESDEYAAFVFELPPPEKREATPRPHTHVRRLLLLFDVFLLEYECTRNIFALNLAFCCVGISVHRFAFQFELITNIPYFYVLCFFFNIKHSHISPCVCEGRMGMICTIFRIRSPSFRGVSIFDSFRVYGEKKKPTNTHTVTLVRKRLGPGQ